jgi:hypothetical protein
VAIAGILHPVLHALPDVVLAVDPATLRVVDVNRATVFGYARDALTTLALDALLEKEREQLARFVRASDGRPIDVGVRLDGGAVVHASAVAAASAAAASAPCVLVVLREAGEHARVLAEIERLRGVLAGAADSLTRLLALGASPSNSNLRSGPSERPPEADPTPLPDLTLQQYASLCVEAELYAANVKEVDARYGLASEAARSELHRIWGEKLAADAATKEQWSALIQQYRTYFQAQQRAREEPPLSAQPDPREVRRHQRTTSPSAVLRGPPLPFARADGDEDAEGAPMVSTGAAQEPAARSTIGVANAFRGAGALPFKGADAPEITLEQYSALSIELESYPERRAEFLGLYGIASEAAWRACDDLWSARFVADAALRERWMKLTAELRTKLARR